jgi:capsular polysaccharide biosynthesis protein
MDQAPSRIYVTRRTARMRRVANEDELTPLLERFGIQVIDPGGLSFAKQAALFACAEFIIGPHGAGLTNMVLAPALRTVVELLPDSFDQGVTSYSALSDVLEIDYHLLFGERCDAGSSARPANVHFTIDLSRLATLLERVLSSGNPVIR